MYLFHKKLLILKIMALTGFFRKNIYLTNSFDKFMHCYLYRFPYFFTKNRDFIYKTFEYVKNTLHLYTS